MDNEVYSENRNIQVLEHGSVDGFNYYIISYSSHPCCYVEIPKGHELYGVNYDEYYDNNCYIDCHGGITYSESYLLNLKNSWFIGWDYAHYGDYSMMNKIVFGSDYGTKYGLDELRNDVIDVISQL